MATLLQLHHPTSLVKPLSRPSTARAGVTLAAAVLAVVIGGCSRTECTGDVYCPNFSPDKCVNIPGCSATPACLNEVDKVPGMSSCPKYVSASSCQAPACTWTGGACIDTCAMQTDSASCYAVALVHDMNGNLTFGCHWYLCSGTPRNVSCGDFSVDSCPADRCSVKTFCDVFPDC